MYFAQNPSRAETAKQLRTAVTEHRAQSPGSRCYALIDTAFDETLARRLAKQAPERWQSIYQDTQLSGLSDVSPCLMELPVAGGLDNQTDRLIACCSGRPMLGFLFAPLSLAALAEHLRQLIEVRTDDEVRWPLRFADTRITPALLGVLDPEQRSALFAPLDAWGIIGRNGELQFLVQPETTHPPARTLGCPPTITDDQFAQLVAASEADAIIETMTTAAPELLINREPASVHSVVREHCLLADQHGISGHEDRARLALLGLSLPPGRTSGEPLRSLLPRVSRGEPLAELLNQLPESFWNNDHA